jgi:hypothetical protein
MLFINNYRSDEQAHALCESLGGAARRVLPDGRRVLRDASDLICETLQI